MGGEAAGPWSEVVELHWSVGREGADSAARRVVQGWLKAPTLPAAQEVEVARVAG